jgi:arsenite-transporting ATPase
MRIILYTGKGGVGKTSVAAATALRCAELGLRTVVVSTDTAHSLGDSLDVELGPEPKPVRENLWAQEIDVHYSIEKHWGKVQQAMASVLAGQGVDKMVADELSILPGLEEGASLLWINQYVREQTYEVVVIDAAPTAETLRLLSLPDVGRWWFERLFPIGRTARAFAPLVRAFSNQTLDPSILDAAERMFEQLGNVHKYLSDPALTSVRLVMNAERMVVKESQRTYTYLNLYGYTVDAVVCNRLIPEEVTDPYFAGWKESQRRS